MHKFFLHPFTVAVFGLVVIMGLIGILFVLPLYCIHTTWNLVLAHYCALPFITVYQALLLYSALLIVVVLALRKLNFNKDNLV